MAKKITEEVVSTEKLKVIILDMLKEEPNHEFCLRELRSRLSKKYKIVVDDKELGKILIDFLKNKIILITFVNFGRSIDLDADTAVFFSIFPPF